MSREILTYLEHSLLAQDRRYLGIIIPLAINTENQIIENTLLYLNGWDPLELLIKCSMLNMAVQTYELAKIMILQKSFLKLAGFESNYKQVLLHRFCLLKVIELILINYKELDLKKQKNLTAKEKSAKLILALSTINSVYIDKDDTRFIIRDYPHNLSEILFNNIQISRILRCYLIFCKSFGNRSWNAIRKDFSKINNITFTRYIKLISKLWLFMDKSFDIINIDSFYLYDKKFRKYKNELKLLSFEQSEFESFESKKFQGIYSLPLSILNKAIFKIDSKKSIIIDISSLLDSNLGLIYSLSKSLKINIRKFKLDNYNKYMEIIFSKILKKIFPYKVKYSGDDKSYPDAYIKVGNKLLIFEFTTAEIGFNNLYSGPTDKFKKRIYEILFEYDNQKDKSSGKMYKISKYIQNLKYTFRVKEIYPFLITDNYLGDLDLLIKLDHTINVRLKTDSALLPLQNYKLTILSFDDIFIIWERINLADRLEKFISLIDAWNSADKPKYLYNFSEFLLYTLNEVSNDYAKFLKSNLNKIDL